MIQKLFKSFAGFLFMAVMSRRKRSIAQSWKATDEQRNKENSEIQEKANKSISEEEHQARIKQLRELGLIKD